MNKHDFTKDFFNVGYESGLNALEAISKHDETMLYDLSGLAVHY